MDLWIRNNRGEIHPATGFPPCLLNHRSTTLFLLHLNRIRAMDPTQGLYQPPRLSWNPLLHLPDLHLGSSKRCQSIAQAVKVNKRVRVRLGQGRIHSFKKVTLEILNNLSYDSRFIYH
jgi:hypothetical protein